jgi:L-malate glycosyltransferase
LARDALVRSRRVIAVSPGLRAMIQSGYPDIPVDVIGNVVKTRYFTPAPEQTTPKATRRFLTISLLTPQKGLDYLLAAAQQLRERGHRQFEIVIGGDGAIRGQLERQALELGLGDTCRFLGLLDRAQVRDQMRQCDVFMLPSRYETFGIVLGEAMACGRPVIATRCGGPEFFVTPESGLLVEPHDVAGLTDAMEQFIVGKVHYDPQRIRQSVVDRFGEDAFLENITRLYGEVLAKRPSA